MKAKVKGYSDLVTLVGSMLEVPVGTVLLAEGQWKTNGKYGQQFQVETYEVVLPATVYGIEKYLGSGLIKGIGPKFARAIPSALSPLASHFHNYNSHNRKYKLNWNMAGGRRYFLADKKTFATFVGEKIASP